MLAPKAKVLADAAGVRFETKVQFDGKLSNREADLILLILENLVQNGIEATPAGKTVEVMVTGTDGAISFEVCDQGSGLPAGTETRLFMPCTSVKIGGGGIGLAISKQLAQSLGAQLELAGNSSPAAGSGWSCHCNPPSATASPKFWRRIILIKFPVFLKILCVSQDLSGC